MTEQDDHHREVPIKLALLLSAVLWIGILYAAWRVFG